MPRHLLSKSKSQARLETQGKKQGPLSEKERIKKRRSLSLNKHWNELLDDNRTNKMDVLDMGLSPRSERKPKFFKPQSSYSSQFKETEKTEEPTLTNLKK